MKDLPHETSACKSTSFALETRTKICMHTLGLTWQIETLHGTSPRSWAGFAHGTRHVVNGARQGTWQRPCHSGLANSSCSLWDLSIDTCLCLRSTNAACKTSQMGTKLPKVGNLLKIERYSPFFPYHSATPHSEGNMKCGS